MTVQELINELEKIKDKRLPVYIPDVAGGYDEAMYVDEWHPPVGEAAILIE